MEVMLSQELEAPHFSFVLPSQPEKDGYTKDEATTLKYNTSSTNCFWINH